MTAVTVSSTGRITIPAAVRRELGWEPGTRLDVSVRGEVIYLRRIRTVAELAGILRPYAKPGTTHEQEREAMYKAIAEHYAEVVKQAEE